MRRLANLDSLEKR